MGTGLPSLALGYYLNGRATAGICKRKAQGTAGLEDPVIVQGRSGTEGGYKRRRLEEDKTSPRRALRTGTGEDLRSRNHGFESD
jgi:hypothetical protein